MAGFFQNLKVVSERNDMDPPASNAYVTTSTDTNVVQSSTTQITPEGTQSNILTVQPIPQGFGAYLDGILPPDIAKAAGAFSVSMQQIKNITSVPIEKFAQVVNSLETTKNLNVNGTSVPTDTTLSNQGLDLIALGNGPYGTYTMSNFLGCMSGLPYLGIDIDGLTKNLQTATLIDIYKNIYLSTAWQQATATWNGTTFTFINRGGGYTSPPTVTVDGNPATATIGTDPEDITTYSKIISISYSGAAGTVVIDPPSGSWPAMNTVIQNYIDAANAEILSIKNNKPATAQQLITNWEFTGTLLSTEQRAIDTGMQIAVPNDIDHPREIGAALFPSTQYSFVDSIPTYATYTQPHMYSQTLEAIANYNTVGGRSLVALLRQSRNQARLQEAGIPVDNNIENKLSRQQESELIANGVLGGSVPATLVTEIGSPTPFGYYNPIDERYYSGGQVVDIGEAVEPGSFAGSPYSNLIPPQLSVIYASDVLLPATYSVQEAIDEVIRCNCDCWDNI